MQSVQAIFFDVGDTLVYDDPPVEERLWAAVQEHGVAFPREKLVPALRKAETVALGEYLRGRPPETTEVARAMLRILLADAVGISPGDRDLDAVAASYRCLPFERKAQPRSLNLLSELRDRGFVLGVISDWEADLGDLLASLGILQFLSAMAVSAVVGVTKPHPRLFQAALDQAHVSSTSSIHIGDFVELDVAGAESVGMRAMLFDSRRRSLDFPWRVETFDELCNGLLSLEPPAA